METQNATLKLEVKRFKEQYDWSSDFNDREIAEILLALDYKLHFDHGTLIMALVVILHIL